MEVELMIILMVLMIVVSIVLILECVEKIVNSWNYIVNNFEKLGYIYSGEKRFGSKILVRLGRSLKIMN